MRRWLIDMLPHLVILIGNMYAVFYFIDRVNPAMNFIDNGLTKGLLLILCFAALILALPEVIHRQNRRHYRRYWSKRR